MSDLRADLDAMLRTIYEQPWRPYQPPLVSLPCGLEDRHEDCRSAICECSCHVAALAGP